jgi:hypothetical protein
MKNEIKEFCDKIRYISFRYIPSCPNPSIEDVDKEVLSHVADEVKELEKGYNMGDFDQYMRMIKRDVAFRELKEKGDLIRLDNGKWLSNQYGKYQPKLSFIIEELSDYTWADKDLKKEIKKAINVLWDGTPEFMFGDFKISKKGTNCFYPKNKDVATHILIKLSWGGAFSKTCGDVELQHAVYTAHRRSNGGGLGCNYYIIPVGRYNVYREEDI